MLIKTRTDGVIFLTFWILCSNNRLKKDASHIAIKKTIIPFITTNAERRKFPKLIAILSSIAIVASSVSVILNAAIDHATIDITVDKVGILIKLDVNLIITHAVSNLAIIESALLGNVAAVVNITASHCRPKFY